MVLAGKAAGLQGAGERWPGFVQPAQATGVARFISPAAPQITRVLQKHAPLQAMDEPAGAHAGTYPFINATLINVGSVNFILVRPDLNDARAAAFVQVMRASAAQLAAALPQLVASLPHHCRKQPSSRWQTRGPARHRQRCCTGHSHWLVEGCRLRMHR